MDEYDGFDDLEYFDKDDSDDLESDDLSLDDLHGIGFAFDRLPLGDKYISFNDLPACLSGGEEYCYDCDFFSPENCPLRNNPSLIDEYILLFSTYLEAISSQNKAQYARQKALINAVKNELQLHGRPLHYSVIADMVNKRYPELSVTDKGILFIMMWHPEEFERVNKGVYRAR